jgi:hypothetical protein
LSEKVFIYQGSILGDIWTKLGAFFHNTSGHICRQFNSLMSRFTFSNKYTTKHIFSLGEGHHCFHFFIEKIFALHPGGRFEPISPSAEADVNDHFAASMDVANWLAFVFEGLEPATFGFAAAVSPPTLNQLNTVSGGPYV